MLRNKRGSDVSGTGGDSWVYESLCKSWVRNRRPSANIHRMFLARCCSERLVLWYQQPHENRTFVTATERPGDTHRPPRPLRRGGNCGSS